MSAGPHRTAIGQALLAAGISARRTTGQQLEWRPSTQPVSHHAGAAGGLGIGAGDAAVTYLVVQFYGFANCSQFKYIMKTGLAYYQAHTSAVQPWNWW